MLTEKHILITVLENVMKFSEVMMVYVLDVDVLMYFNLFVVMMDFLILIHVKQTVIKQLLYIKIDVVKIVDVIDFQLMKFVVLMEKHIEMHANYDVNQQLLDTQDHAEEL